MVMKYERDKGKAATIERPERSNFCTESKAKGPILLMKLLLGFSASAKKELVQCDCYVLYLYHQSHFNESKLKFQAHINNEWMN